MDVPLKCECSKVQGLATHISPGYGNRIICYCNDCQAFANYLERGSSILDEYGGTDIFQLSPSQVKITAGKEHIRCIRLRPKGLYRWYTNCCKTPIGNTMSAALPFVGMIHNFMDDGGKRDEYLGPVLAYTLVKSAKETLPDERKQGFPFKVTVRGICKLIVWKIKGLNQPSPFFNPDGTPVSEPEILS